MADVHHFLALDLGAESGRGIIVTLREGKVSMEEIHRWPNRPVRLAGTMHWDFPFLFTEMLQAIRVCTERGVKLAGMSVDTWGVDFGLLGPAGELLGNPVMYRDARTDGIHAYSDPILSRDEIFRLTAYEPWQIASLFQLLAMKKNRSAILSAADTFLNMPDLFLYFLTGNRASEMSIANTSNLMGTDCQWSDRIIDAFGLRKEMFHRLIDPPEVIGPLRSDLLDQLPIGDTPVIATCGHDTSAALAAVPAESGGNWAFLSSGTWSILGSLVDQPVTSPRCLELGFTNEYTIGGWYLARNISGLWLVQQLRKKWDTAADPWDYPRMTDEARKAKTNALFNAAHDSLMAPPDMADAITRLIAASGQPVPATRGEMVRATLESLALEYHRRTVALGELEGKPADRIYLVGGGIHNTLLCQLTADATGLPVHAGADQCTAMGNALGQALALGILKDKQQIREVMRRSFPTTLYEPQDQEQWKEKRARYAELVR